MKNKLVPSVIIMLVLFIAACNSDMLEKGRESAEDPRRPDINVKQSETDIRNGDTFQLVFANGVKVNETSEPQLFTIENLGTADLVISQITVTGDDSAEFNLTEPASPIIPAGTNRTFTISFSPQDTDLKTINVVIQSNDEDEGNYSFTIDSISKPLPQFRTRLRKGILPLTVKFENQSLGPIDSYEWDFNGDGTIDSTEQNPSFTYTETGIYSVALYATGEGGNSYFVKSGYITVVLPQQNEIDPSFSGSIYAAYINNDSYIDIVGAGQNEVAWWENDGTGNFTKHTVQNPYAGAEIVLAVDVDKDDNVDIVASKGSNTGDIDWWQNTGNGAGWSAANSIATGYDFTNTIFAADLNNDTYPDIISMASESDQIYWFENNGDATFNTTGILINSASFGTPNSVIAAYIDNDTTFDVLCSGSETAGVSWWENANDLGTSWNVYSIISDYYVNSIYSDDIDGDAIQDLVGASSTDNEIIWWKNNGDKTFNEKEIIESDFSGAQDVIADDFDGDGKSDIAASAVYLDTIAWWKNISNDSVEFQRYNISTDFLDPLTIFAADLNGDGKKDIIAGSSTENISWWDIHQNGIWDKHYIEPFFPNAYNVISADLNSDGLTDIIYNNYEDILFRLNTGNGHLSSIHEIVKGTSGLESIYAVDINGDNYNDIVVNAGSNISAWYNDGQGNFGSRQYLAYPPLPNDFCRTICPSDLDGDGDTDIIAAERLDATGDELIWWENDGSGNFGSENIIYSGTAPYITRTAGSIHTADLNNDTFIDIIIGDSSVVQQNILVLFNNGSEIFDSPIEIDNSFNGVSQVFISDIDGDGYQDIIAAAVGEYEIAWWKNNGDETFSSRNTIIDNYDFASAVYVTDMNGDNYPDVIGAAAYDDNISLFINKNGDGSAWSKELLTSEFDYARSVYAADIDDDGDPDILGAAMNGSEISWWENNLKEYGP